MIDHDFDYFSHDLFWLRHFFNTEQYIRFATSQCYTCVCVCVRARVNHNNSREISAVLLNRQTPTGSGDFSPKRADWIWGSAASYSMGSGFFFPVLKRPGLNVYHSQSRSAEVKNDWTHLVYSNPPYAFVASTENNSPCKVEEIG